MVALLALTLASSAFAQSYPTPAMERARIAEIMGDSVPAAANPYFTDWIPLLKKVPLLPRAKLRVLEPSFLFVHNSEIPYTLNDGPLWAGRGRNWAVSAGVGFDDRVGPITISVAVAPTWILSQNRPFQIFPSLNPDRQPYASPFYDSADLPLRFGDDRTLLIDPGRSQVSVSYRAVKAGVTAENETWGPAIRGQLIMSGNAPGVPRVYLGTAKPIRTRIGLLSGKVIAGVLTESRFFNGDTADDYRSLSGMVVTLQPAFDTSLTFGFERVVYAPTKLTRRALLRHSIDVLQDWEHLPRTDSLPTVTDQIAAVFARWVFPRVGMEVYAELARMDLPRSFQDLMLAFHNTGAYTLGLQWAQPRRSADRLRLQTEFTYLEQSLVYPNRPPPDFYTGTATVHGYTHRGQAVGAGIGPGGSSQWIAGDYFSPRWRAGAFAGRVRWNNDEMYRISAANFFRHDVTILGGVRGGWSFWRSEFSLDATYSHRFNYLFQFGGANPGGHGTVDLHNLTVALAVTPR